MFSITILWRLSAIIIRIDIRETTNTTYVEYSSQEPGIFGDLNVSSGKHTHLETSKQSSDKYDLECDKGCIKGTYVVYILNATKYDFYLDYISLCFSQQETFV